MLKAFDINYTNLQELISNWYLFMGLSEIGSYLLTFLSLIIALILIYIVVYIAVGYALRFLHKRLNKFSITKFDNLLIKNKVFKNIGRLIPLIVTINLLPVFFEHYDFANAFFNRIIDIVLVFIWVFLFRG